METLVHQRGTARGDLANDVDVLAGPRHGLPVGHPVPALDHARTRSPDSQQEAAAGQCAERHRRHRRAGGSPRRHLHDGRADLDVPGSGKDPGGNGNGIAA